MPACPRRRPGDSKQSFTKRLFFFYNAFIVTTSVMLNPSLWWLFATAACTTRQRPNSADTQVNWPPKRRHTRLGSNKQKHPAVRAKNIPTPKPARSFDMAAKRATFPSRWFLHVPLTSSTGMPPRPLCLSPTSWARELFFGSTLRKTSLFLGGETT